MFADDFTPQEDFIPSLADMINGTRHLTDKELEDVRNHIALVLSERKNKRREELRNTLINTYNKYRAEFPVDSFYVDVEDNNGDIIEVDLLELIDNNIENF